MGTATRFPVKKLNTDKKTMTGNDGWTNKDFEVVTDVCTLMFEVVLEVCVRKTRYDCVPDV